MCAASRYDELLPYDEFALTLHVKQIPNLKAVLEAVTPDAHAKMREAMRRHAGRLFFNGSSIATSGENGEGEARAGEHAVGDAYDSLVTLLRRRAAELK